MKKLSGLTQEEIGQLYPVEISSYDAQWPVLFLEEKQRISAAIDADSVLRIEHFGSTAVLGLPAKNTIDILVEMPTAGNQPDEVIARMEELGYEFMWQTDGNPAYLVFVKGYDPEYPKAQTYHVHMAPSEHALWDRVYFRDYLRQQPDIAQEYAELKQTLALHHRHARVAYRVAKTDFVTRITIEAKKILG